VTLLAAYNRNENDDVDDTALGGGPFFTSMEDQTVDAIGTKGDAVMFALGADLDTYGAKGWHIGAAYGRFASSDDATPYDAREIDTGFDYTYDERFNITAVYARIEHKNDGLSDYDLFRIIANYNW
jgi:hypothetical protein